MKDNHFDAVVIGAGFYGSLISIYLNKNKNIKKILLIDKEAEIMKRSSSRNQARIHNGYHYPRSFMTANRSHLNFSRFVTDWITSVKKDFISIYAIAKNNSKVSSHQFKMFCNKVGVPITEAKENLKKLFNMSLISNVYVTEEYTFDANIFKSLVLNEINKTNINLQLNSEVKRISKKNNDIILITSTKGKSINITSKRGTNLNLKISKRKANSCPGYVVKNGDLGSPPDIEANISPLEQFSNGIAFIDGSVTHPKIKLLKKPIKLIIKNGKIHEIEVDDKNVKKILNKIFQKKSSKRRVLAECGIGLNPKAKLSGHMLTDEGSKGCIHLGFGANHTVGGKNKINFHIDLVMKNTSLYVDNKLIIDKGKLQI